MGLPVIVPDASVLVKWALESTDEGDRESALAIRKAWLSGKCEIIVPSLWVYEVGNVLGLKEPLLASQLLEILIKYRFQEESPANFYGKIFELMTRLKASFYDAAYHAAAFRHNGAFVTADDRYFRRARRLGHVVTLRNWSAVL